MSEKLSREIRKLEVRLEAFVREEEVFVKGLTKCLDKFRVLNKNLERLKIDAASNEAEALTKLRQEAIKALSEALKRGSEAEHEKSHLLESYGALILALEGAFKGLPNHS